MTDQRPPAQFNMQGMNPVMYPQQQQRPRGPPQQMRGVPPMYANASYYPPTPGIMPFAGAYMTSGAYAVPSTQVYPTRTQAGFAATSQFTAPQGQSPSQSASRPKQSRPKRVLTITDPNTKEVVVPGNEGQSNEQAPPSSNGAAPPAPTASIPAQEVSSPVLSGGASPRTKQKKILEIKDPESAAQTEKKSSPLKPSADTPVQSTASNQPSQAESASQRHEELATRSHEQAGPKEEVQEQPKEEAQEQPKEEANPVEHVAAEPASKPEPTKQDVADQHSTDQQDSVDRQKTPVSDEQVAAQDQSASTTSEGEDQADEADEDADAEPVDNSPEYDPNCWSPAHPDQPKIYSLQLLKTFRDLCRKRIDNPNPQLRSLFTGEKTPLSSNIRNARRSSSGPPRGSASAPVRGNKPRGSGGGVGSLSFSKRPKRSATTPNKVIVLQTDFKPLEKTENEWKRPAEQQIAEHERILLEAQGVMNKLTEETFEKLSTKLIELGESLSDEYMDQFIGRIFKKAIDEPFFCSMYAKLCRKMSVEKRKDGSLRLPMFRKLLLNSCQREFEKDRSDEKKRLDFMADKAKNPDKERTPEDEEEEYRLSKARRHMFGNIKFIGELFVQEMVSAGIIHKECIQPLLYDQNADEDAFECLCKLFETAGAKLEASPEGKTQVGKYIEELKAISQRPKLPSRIKFMILDVLDMRKRGWKARREKAGPKKLDDLHKDIEKEQMRKQANMARDRANRSSREKAPAPKQQPSSWTSANKGARRGFGDSKARESTTLGNRAKFQPDKGGPVRLGGANKFAALDTGSDPAAAVPETEGDKPLDEKLTRTIKSTVEEYLNIKQESEVKMCLKDDIKNNRAFVQVLMTMAADRNPNDYATLITLLDALLKDKLISGEDFGHGAIEALKQLADLKMDAPKVPEFMAEAIAVGLKHDLLKSPFLTGPHIKDMRNDAIKFVCMVFKFLAKHTSQEATRASYKQMGAPLVDFDPRKSEDTVNDMLERYDIQFLVSEESAASSNVSHFLEQLQKVSATDVLAKLDELVPASARDDESVLVPCLQATYQRICARLNSGDSGFSKDDSEKSEVTESMAIVKSLVNEESNRRQFAITALQMAAHDLKRPQGLFEMFVPALERIGFERQDFEHWLSHPSDQFSQARKAAESELRSALQ